MLFNSFAFGLFLPISLLLYWAVGFNRIKWQNVILLVASYLFYGLWDWRFLFLIIASSLVDYFAGGAIGGTENRFRQRIFLYSSIFWNLGVLFLFKYYNFFIDEFAMLFNIQHEYGFNSLNLILPVGLSFYTFQTMSYTIDVYKGRISHSKNILNFLCYVSFFPQLVAGPIEKAADLLPQFNTRRRFDLENTKNGLRQILWGLFKKMVIADNAARVVNIVYAGSENYGSLTLVFASLMFFFQIYGDFSGYSDIAIGTAKLFGFKLTKNFNIPYLARSSTEFWQRWHITLTRWFNDYIYFPIIQKNIRSARRRNYAIMITMLLIGLWHGANWTFIIFGLLQGILIILERTPLTKDRKSSLFHTHIVPRPIGIILTFVFITASCILFRSQSIGEAWFMFKRIFSFEHSPALTQFLDKRFAIFLLVLIIGEILTRKKDFPLLNINRYISRPIRWAIYYFFIYIIFRYAGPTENFIYFQF